MKTMERIFEIKDLKALEDFLQSQTETRSFFDYNIIGFAYEFFDLIIRYVLIEINADPIFLIHVPAWFYTGIFSLQFSRFVRVTFDATKIENLNVNETKPFVRNIKA